MRCVSRVITYPVFSVTVFTQINLGYNTWLTTAQQARNYSIVLLKKNLECQVQMQISFNHKPHAVDFGLYLSII